MTALLTAEELEGLRRLDACTLANAVETFDRRLRNEGFVDHTIRCLFPHLQPMVGYAATLSIRGSAPPTDNNAYVDRTDWWDYVQSLPTPRVVVVQDKATRTGSVRDIPAAESAGFHYFAGSVAVSHAYVHVVDVGRPVEMGGLTIRSGDLLHGDLHGVQSVPLDIAGQIPPVAARIAAQEQALIELCRSDGFTLDKLRAMLASNRT